MSEKAAHLSWSALDSSMRLNFGLLAIGMIFLATDVKADSFSVNAKSGETTAIHAYSSHIREHGECISKAATIDVVAEPRHGAIIPHVIDSVIGANPRFGTSRGCAGTPIKKLQIDYKSTPGYRGEDTFTLHVVLGSSGTQTTDTWTVTVQ